MSFVATWVDLEIIILRKVNQTEEDKYHTISYLNPKKKKKIITYKKRKKKKDTNEVICRTETDS